MGHLRSIWIRKFGSDTSDFASAVLCHCCWFNDRRKKTEIGLVVGWRVFGDGKAVKSAARHEKGKQKNAICMAPSNGIGQSGFCLKKLGVL